MKRRRYIRSLYAWYMMIFVQVHTYVICWSTSGNSSVTWFIWSWERGGLRRTWQWDGWSVDWLPGTHHAHWWEGAPRLRSELKDSKARKARKAWLQTLDSSSTCWVLLILRPTIVILKRHWRLLHILVLWSAFSQTSVFCYHPPARYFTCTDLLSSSAWQDHSMSLHTDLCGGRTYHAAYHPGREHLQHASGCTRSLHLHRRGWRLDVVRRK